MTVDGGQDGAHLDPVQHQRFGGQMHGFFTMLDVLPGSEAAMAYVSSAVSRHLATL